LDSVVPIRVNARFQSLGCTASSGTLASTGATAWSYFTGGSGVYLNTWYPIALINKLVEVDISAAYDDVNLYINSDVGASTCLGGSPFYLGIDGNSPTTSIHLLVVLLHEITHGLGFITRTSGISGAMASSKPTVFDQFLLDKSTGRTWADTAETNAQRKASAINGTGTLVWNGPQVMADSVTLLTHPPQIRLTSPTVTSFPALAAAFGPYPTSLTKMVMPVSSPATGAACNPLGAVDAGAVGVIIANNVAGTISPGGADSTITIPTVAITLADAATLRTYLATRTRTTSNVTVTIGTDLNQYAGADTLGRMYMYAPPPSPPARRCPTGTPLRRQT
jgi:hypothetical protein